MNDITLFMVELKGYKKALSSKAFKCIRGQALSGDIGGAKKGLGKLLKEKKLVSSKTSN